MKPELGVCYYPEHWPEAMWADDAARMVETGLTWVRIGEFAWSRMEPTPGHLKFDWLDCAIETLGKRRAEGCPGDTHGNTAALDAGQAPRHAGR